MNQLPPRSGVNVLQLETGVAGPVKVFQDSLIVNIPRSRFLPVKKTCDLMLVMSNLYTLDKGTLIMSPNRVYQTTPVVELGDEHFKKVCLLALRHGFSALLVHLLNTALIQRL